LAEYPLRYGGYGGIAYHHVTDTYVALFSHFVPCGVWEAIYILEGLLKNTSDLQPTTAHGDTQAVVSYISPTKRPKRHPDTSGANHQ
jgi:TnpA family transposase